MKRIIQYVILFSLLITFFVTQMIYAAPDMIGICNLTGGEQKAGTFEIKGVILNDGQVTRVAVKTGIGPWENATGVDRFSYTVNTRQIVLRYDNGAPIYGPAYGDLSIVIGAFKANGDQLSEKTVNITVIPEKPSTDLFSGVYLDPVNVVLKAMPEVTSYYTTDGTDPKISGISYTGPIYINQNTIIKAVTKSATNQYSETAILDLKIDNANPPGFLVQYYEDQAFNQPLPDPAYLKAGVYYLKIVSDRKFSSGPFIDLDAPGATNDVINANLTPVSDCVFRYTRLISDDFAATGDIQETITIRGTDNHGNPIQNLIPVNATSKAGFPDTQAPAQGSITITGGSSTNDPTSRLDINSTGAAWMRLALSESGLAAAPWVEYAAQYDEFDIASGGNGNKTIWAEFKDRAGNIQSQHASTNVYFDSVLLSFDIEYFSDNAFTKSLGNNPYLKAGTYYLKITANQDLGVNPAVQIDAEGINNDVASGLTVMFNPRIFYYTRTIMADSAALGATREQITVQGISLSNLVKAAYTDTQPPGIPVVSGPATTFDLKPNWTWTNVTGAIEYRYSFTDGFNWAETTSFSYTPADNLTPGNSYSLYVQAGDQAGNWSASGSFSITVNTTPVINVKQGTVNIPNGTGSFSFGDVSVFSYSNAAFTVENTGSANLNLTGSPRVQISGADASYFTVINETIEPSATIGPCQNSPFTIRFTPNDFQTRTATVSIINNDTARNPYTFTITGTGVATELTLNTWMEGNFPVLDDKTYSFNTIPGKQYGISVRDSWQGLPYTGREWVTVYRQDLTTAYFDLLSSAPRFLTALDNIVYVKVSCSITGSYALKAFLDEPAMVLKQGTTVIPNGGSYDCGTVSLCPGNTVTFTIENTGGGNLNLTDSPKVRFSGTDASSFRVSSDPPDMVAGCESDIFTISCEPNGTGTKTATVSIASNDPAENPYTFTISETGTLEGTLTLDTWTAGNISPGERKTYCLNATPGRSYAINWDDSVSGSGTYTGDVVVSAYRQDGATNYFVDIDNGYDAALQAISAQDSLVYITVKGKNPSSSGTFALKAYIYEPVMSIKENGNNLILNGGNYDFGNVSLCSYREPYFYIYNNGNAPLELNGFPDVQISGPDASQFKVTHQPSSFINPAGIDGFDIKFAPTSVGPKNATVTIPNNDPDQTPYNFTITGNGFGTFTPLTIENWTAGSLATANEVKLYSFAATPGSAYAIHWDDTLDGTGNYYNNVEVSAFRPDLTTTYFKDVNSGYSYPQVIIAQDDIVYIKVAAWSATCDGPYALLVSLSEPVINVKQGAANLPNGTGSHNYGPVTINTNSSVSFTVENIGDDALHLIDNSPAQITGPDASSFEISTQPSATINIHNSSNLNVRFSPTSTGVKNATVSIGSDDATHNPYTFTVTGYGAPVIDNTLTFGCWAEGNIAAAGEEKYYSYNVTAGKKYVIVWNDFGQGSGSYNGDIKVTAYRSDFLTPYFTDINAGYAPPQFVTAQDTKIYIKVAPLNPSSTGSFALKISESIINVKKDATDIPYSSGSFGFGSVALGSNASATFMIENTGNVNLNLTGTPKVQISGPDASCFSVTAQPPNSPFSPGGYANFTITFTPSGVGTKTATVSIESDDAYCNPFTFTVTGAVAAANLSLGIWTPDTLSAGQVKTYYFNATPGTDYAIAWDDSFQGSGSYTCDIVVSAYRQDYTTPYFSNWNSGFSYCQTFTAQDSIVYLKVAGYSSGSTGSFALKPFLGIPVMNLKQGSTIIPNNTGNYNYGNISVGSNSSITFTIQNNGTGSLHLTGSPKIQISGTDASHFSVTTQPESPIVDTGSTTFTVKFAPTTFGAKTATICIASDDATNNPYTFTITGTGTGTGIPLTFGAWNSGSLSSYEVKTYNFLTTPGTVYAIAWDDSYQGTGSYTCDIKVSAYRQDLTTAYFSNNNSGYASPQMITAQDSIVYLKVAGYNSSSFGSFALKPSLYQPAINVKQGSTNIPNGTGSYDFGSVATTTPSSINFTIYNSGVAYLYLNGSPQVQISGTDASQFSVTAQPTYSLEVGESTTFTVRFAPSTSGVKTATISIASNDNSNNPYTFTINGTGINVPLTSDAWNFGGITTAGEVKTYDFNTIPGTVYAISWDDSNQGSGTLTCDIKVSAYRQDLTTAYFNDIDSGYTSPQTITAQDSVAYIKVAGYSSGSTGTFALKPSLNQPTINVGQGSTSIPNGTGSYSYENVAPGSSRSVTFTIRNTGVGSLNLTGSPLVQISGTDASLFTVTLQPSATISANGSATFTLKFAPTTLGIKTATVSIASNDPNNTTYAFTVTGTGSYGEELILGTYIPGNLSTAYQAKKYWFSAIPGRTYKIYWDDGYQGSGNYNCDIQVNCYRQNLTTAYFGYTNSAYLTPKTITAQDNIVYLNVTSLYGGDFGTFALKVVQN